MFKRMIALVVCFTLIISNFHYVYAQDFSVNQLPEPGSMVGLSSSFAPMALKGIVVNLKKPLEFQFIMDTGHGSQDVSFIKEEANKLVKYFLAGLTIPEGELWVNLSPYEKDRITTVALGQTELGRDLLAQDYILKQLTASLIYPEKELGKEFWSKVYKEAQEKFGTTNVPVSTFNKVWILPDQAQVYEHGAAAYVTKATLKVLLEADYLAMEKNTVSLRGRSPVGATDEAISKGTINPKKIASFPSVIRNDTRNTNTFASIILREIVIPEITKEVNTGKNFALLRQIYQAMILAKWYKQTIQNGLLDALYTNKKKTAGINLNDPTVKEQIYQRYLQAYKKGAFNFIKEDPAPNGQIVPRKYFSGGTSLAMTVKNDGTRAMVSADGLGVLDIALRIPLNAAMTSRPLLPEQDSVESKLAHIRDEWAIDAYSKEQIKVGDKLLENIKRNNMIIREYLLEEDSTLQRAGAAFGQIGKESVRQLIESYKRWKRYYVDFLLDRQRSDLNPIQRAVEWLNEQPQGPVHVFNLLSKAKLFAYERDIILEDILKHHSGISKEGSFYKRTNGPIEIDVKKVGKMLKNFLDTQVIVSDVIQALNSFYEGKSLKNKQGKAISLRFSETTEAKTSWSTQDGEITLEVKISQDQLDKEPMHIRGVVENGLRSLGTANLVDCLPLIKEILYDAFKIALNREYEASRAMTALPLEIRSRLERPILLLLTDMDGTAVKSKVGMNPESAFELKRFCSLPSGPLDERSPYSAVITGSDTEDIDHKIASKVDPSVNKRMFKVASNGAEIFAPETEAPIVQLRLSEFGDVKLLQGIVQEAIEELGFHDVIQVLRETKIRIPFSPDDTRKRILADTIRNKLASKSSSFRSSPNVTFSSIAVDVSFATKKDGVVAVVEKVAEKLGISVEGLYSKALAMGDNENDIPMLNHVSAKGGIAVWVGSEPSSDLSSQVIRLPANIKNEKGFEAVLKANSDWRQEFISGPKGRPGNQAMNTNQAPTTKLLRGGIDLNQINPQRTGTTIKVQFDPAQLAAFEQGGFEGFTPEITGFQFIQSPLPLLGVVPRKEELLAKG